MAGSIERKLTIGFHLCHAADLRRWDMDFYREVKGFLASDRWVEHTHAVIDDLQVDLL